MNPRDLEKLSDLFGQDLAGWQIAPCYFLELDHTLMGHFPAMTAGRGGDVIYTLNKAMLQKVWRGLMPRPAKITSFMALVYLYSHVAFSLENGIYSADTKPKRLISDKAIEGLSKIEYAFCWAPGFIQLKDEPVHDPVFA